MSAPLNLPRPTRLKVTDDKGFEKVLLIDVTPLSIGREAKQGLVMPEDAGPTIAALHALIIREGEDYVLKDQSGPRGTRVNGRPIRRTVLKHGDQIRLGSSSYKIQFLVEGTRVSDLEENRIKALLEVLKDLHSSFEVKEVSARAVAGLMQLLGPSWAALALKGERGGLEMAAAGDMSGELPDSPSRIAQQVIGSARTHFRPERLCTPVRAEQVVLGAIDLGRREAGPYRASDLELLEALAAHVGVALANARRLKGPLGIVTRIA